MDFFSSDQEENYTCAKQVIIQRLEKIFDQSKTMASQEALLFILTIMQQQNTDTVRAIIDIFYEHYPLIQRFLIDLNGWLKAENNDSQFIKSLTDLRARAQDKQGPEFVAQIEREFARKITKDLQLWCEKKAPENFYKTKYLLLCSKYSAIITPLTPLP